MQAKRDENYIPVSLGVLNTDGSTPTALNADPTTHILDIEDNTTGDDNGGDYAQRDENSVTTMTATDANGNVISLYVNADNQLLIDSN
jgi:hypothetical protein